MGGAIFSFSQKIGLKSTKNMRFCILHKPMGGLEPPSPLATLLGEDEIRPEMLKALTGEGILWLTRVC